MEQSHFAPPVEKTETLFLILAHAPRHHRDHVVRHHHPFDHHGHHGHHGRRISHRSDDDGHRDPVCDDPHGVRHVQQ